MVQKIKLVYLNPQLNIAFNNWQLMYLSVPPYHRLFPEVHRGNLVYRLPGSSKRISYAQIKKGVQKKSTVVEIKTEMPPF